MKTINFLILAGAISLCSFGSHAQNILSDTLIWKCSEIKNKATNNQFSIDTQVITNGNGSIDWIQGSNAKSFVVSSVSGTWQDLESDGMITFIIQSELESSITFKRINGKVFIEFSFKRGGAETMPFEFSVMSINLKSNP